MKKLIKAIICTAVFVFIASSVLSLLESTYGELEFTAGNYTDYYYLTLDETEKQAYTAVREQIYSFPEEIAAPVLTKEQLEDVLNALLYDDPMMFMLSTCTLKTQGERAYFIPDYTMTQGEYASRSGSINEILTLLKKEIPTSSEFDAELFCHDYIVNTCTYSDTEDPDENTVVGVFLGGSAKCTGYAKAFKLLLNTAGIESVLVTGTATDYEGNSQSHMWNAVKIGGSWCYTDTTWNDPVSDSGEEYCRHIYFNMTEEMLSRTHSEFDFSQSCDDPSIYYYIIYGAYFDSCDSGTVSAISSLITEAINNDTFFVELMFTSSALTQQAQEYLFENEKIYRALETARIETGMPIVTDSVRYTVEADTNLITIFFEIKE